MNLFEYLTKKNIIISAIVLCVLCYIWYRLKPVEYLSSDDQVSVVLFYSTQCGACTNARPEWNKFKELNKGKVNITEIAMEDEGGQEICNENDIKYFPTVRVYDNTQEKKMMKEFDIANGLTSDGLSDFIKPYVY
jgi:thiol-disulfide isomerase/thioredoxin